MLVKVPVLVRSPNSTKNALTIDVVRVREQLIDMWTSVYGGKEIKSRVRTTSGTT